MGALPAESKRRVALAVATSSVLAATTVALLIWTPWSSSHAAPRDPRAAVQAYYAALDDAAAAVNRLPQIAGFEETTKAEMEASHPALTRACEFISARLQALADTIPGGGGCPVLLWAYNVYQEESYTPRLGSISSEAPHVVKRDGRTIVVSTLAGRLADPGSTFKQHVGLVVVPEDGGWKIASIYPAAMLNEEIVPADTTHRDPVSEALKQYRKLQRFGTGYGP